MCIRDSTCPDTCPCHEKLIRNMLMVMAKKNLELSRRSLHTAPKSIRGRLLSYFSQEMVQQGSSRFMIPFNRQELADYLGVDRSALSNELGKMRKEGIIEARITYLAYAPEIAAVMLQRQQASAIIDARKMIVCLLYTSSVHASFRLLLQLLSDLRQQKGFRLGRFLPCRLRY